MLKVLKRDDEENYKRTNLGSSLNFHAVYSLFKRNVFELKGLVQSQSGLSGCFVVGDGGDDKLFILFRCKA